MSHLTYRDENSGRTTIVLILCILLILTSAIYIYHINKEKTHSNNAVGGEYDLSFLEKGNTHVLDGEWELYPNLLINPETDDFQNYQERKVLTSVPRNREDHAKKTSESVGYGTYRLKITVPEDGLYGIKTNTIRMSSSIFANGKHMTSIGKPAGKMADIVPESYYEVVAIESENKTIDLVIQVASFEYKSGGIIKSIKFGDFDSILNADRKDWAIDTIAVAISLTVGFYFISNFCQRKGNTYLGYFGLSSILMGVYLSTMNEQIIRMILNVSMGTRMKIQMFAMVMIAFCTIQFVYEYFERSPSKKINNKKTAKALSIILLLELLLLLRNPVTTKHLLSMETIQIILGVTVIICYLCIMYILAKALSKNVDASRYMILLITTVLMYFIIILGKMIFEISFGNLSVIVITVVVISGALLMTDRMQVDYFKARTLSAKLVESDRQKNEFMERAAHELRKPLRELLNLTTSLAEGKKGTLNEEQQEDMIFINREGKRLALLVEDILAASKREIEPLFIRKESVNLYTIVEDILQEMQVFILNNQSVELVNGIPKDFPQIYGDSDRCSQIVYNLVHNAIKFTESGTIIVSARARDNQAVIRVSDTGVGIKEKNLQSIFDIFYMNNEESQAQDGLGIGLPIVKHLVELQGGSITVNSIYKHGTEFVVKLPLYDGLDLEQNSEEDKQNKITRESTYNLDKNQGLKEEIDYSDITVLIVDDEVSNRRVIQNILREMGLESIFAVTGNEALRMIKEEKVDLVILDFMLPDILGDQVCREIRETYSIIEIPILILTASDRNIDMMNAFESGANDYLKKPVEGEELKTRINSLLLMKASVEQGLKKEFQYFYSQISPHFLYNTLNTIIGLCNVDTDKAKDALFHLATYFRGKLDVHHGKQMARLEDELDLVMAYLAIEKMRYADRLEIEYDIDKDAKAMIPPLTIQPLAENAIRHGIVSNPAGGKLKISVKRQDHMVVIIVEDNGAGISKEKQEELLLGNSHRIGFKNSLKKIKIIKNASFELESEIDKGTKITLRIPEVKAYEGNFS